MIRIKKRDKDNQIEIDTEIYERLALMGMKLGRDNVTDFINDMLYYQIRREQMEAWCMFISGMLGISIEVFNTCIKNREDQNKCN